MIPWNTDPSDAAGYGSARSPLGSWLTFGSRVDHGATREIVRAAFDHGINFFDTADVYANGAGEEALGAAIQGLPRPYLVIATKAFFPISDRPNDRGLSRKHLFESVEGSLRRLDTDYLDLHQVSSLRPDDARRRDGAGLRGPDPSGQGSLLGGFGVERRTDRAGVSTRRRPTAPTGRSPTSPSTTCCAAASRRRSCPPANARG